MGSPTPEATADKPAQKPAKKRPPIGRLILLGLAILVFFNPCTLAIVFRVTLFEAFSIDGPAMTPNYQHGDRVVVSKAAYGLFLPFSDGAVTQWGEPAFGEVVIARSPADGIDIIKRVVAVAGDTIAMQGRVLVRNGVAVERRVLGPATGMDGGEATCVEERMDGQRWVVLESDLDVPSDLPAFRVPAGHFFAIGDHRDRSNDSRNPRVGAIPYASVKGRVGPHYETAPSRIECPAP